MKTVSIPSILSVFLRVIGGALQIAVYGLSVLAMLIEKSGYEKRLTRISNILNGIMKLAETQALMRCPNKNAKDQCTAQFGCCYQRKPLVADDPILCTHRASSIRLLGPFVFNWFGSSPHDNNERNDFRCDSHVSSYLRRCSCSQHINHWRTTNPLGFPFRMVFQNSRSLQRLRMTVVPSAFNFHMPKETYSLSRP